MRRIAFRPLKGRLFHRWVVFGVLMSLTTGSVISTNAEELSTAIVKQDPELMAMLLDTLIKWEQEAPEDVKEEIKILRTENDASKIKAAANLGGMGLKAKGALLALAETQKRGTLPAIEARRALEKINKSLVEPLIAKLKDDNLYVRVAAAIVLGDIKDPRAVEPLIAALEDNDGSVRRRAAIALKKMTQQDFGNDYGHWRQWWENQKIKKE
jgi:HEAT repeat protein